jgi:hypothetical protein
MKRLVAAIGALVVCVVGRLAVHDVFDRARITAPTGRDVPARASGRPARHVSRPLCGELTGPLVPHLCPARRGIGSTEPRKRRNGITTPWAGGSIADKT